MSEKDKKEHYQKPIYKVSMNRDLQNWLTEEDNGKVSKKTKKQSSEKKPSGMCQICGMKTAKVVCLKCGKSVCNSHYFNLIGLCEKCLSKESVEEWKNTPG